MTAPKLFCSLRRHTTEESAKRVLWALKANGRIYADRLKVIRCDECGAWHLRRAV